MTTPLCKIARETGGKVPLSCLFLCPHDCRTRVYAGIGSRKTPPDVLATMTKAAQDLAAMGYVLRSGGADGADTAFEKGAVDGAAEVYLPWPGFNGRVGPRFAVPRRGDNWREAMALAAEIHPAWSKVSPGAHALHARNCYQILGADLRSPARFVLCWTDCGAETAAETRVNTGGTRTAIVLAERFGVPVFNLRKPDAIMRLAAAWHNGRWS